VADDALHQNERAIAVAFELQGSQVIEQSINAAAKQLSA
jgi:hypothetical protein